MLAAAKAFCEVSLEEVVSSPPSLFTLQKLVDLVYLNLHRPRQVWIRIWDLVSDHFVKVIIKLQFQI